VLASMTNARHVSKHSRQRSALRKGCLIFVKVYRIERNQWHLDQRSHPATDDSAVASLWIASILPDLLIALRYQQWLLSRLSARF
jgi:hypothetical protein